MFVHIVLVRFGNRLLSGHLLEKSCPLIDHMFYLYFDYFLISVISLFVGLDLASGAPVLGHCILVTSEKNKNER